MSFTDRPLFPLHSLFLGIIMVSYLIASNRIMVNLTKASDRELNTLETHYPPSIPSSAILCGERG